MALLSLIGRRRFEHWSGEGAHHNWSRSIERKQYRKCPEKARCCCACDLEK